MLGSDRFFAVTGGPGAGKTSLIECLGAYGLRHSPEAGRKVIQDQVAKGGDALPWTDPERFAALMLRHESRSYEHAGSEEGVVLFDRGFPDIVGFRRLIGLPVGGELTNAARLKRYNRLVFAAPPWPEIFAQDAERKQTFFEAQATYEAVSRSWLDFGYSLAILPFAPVEARAAFVITTIESELGVSIQKARSRQTPIEI